eukprot:gene22575-23777_t
MRDSFGGWHMTRFLFATTALVGLITAAGAADLGAPKIAAVGLPAMSGDIVAYAGFSRLIDDSDSTESFSPSVIGGAGRVNIWLAPQWSTQLDLNAERTSGKADGSNVSDTSVNLAGHASWRSNGFLLGALASIGSDNDDKSSGHNWNGRFATGALEGQATFGNFQLYAQGGFTDSLSIDTYSFVTARYIRGEARYFATPNLMLSANLGYVHETYDSSGPLKATTWGADVEYKFDKSPVSIFASYQGSYTSEEPDEPGETWKTHTVLAGVKYSFGDQTLQSAATSGATLRDYNPITGYSHLRFNNWE